MSPFDELDALKKQLLLDREQLGQVSCRLTAIACENPGNAWLCTEIGGVFDSAGFEVEACNWYEQALALGEDLFPREQRSDFYIWYGSTLRNVGRLADSEQVLRDALRRWPQSSALQFFLALTLKSQGRGNESISMLTALHLGVWDDSLRRYSSAVQSYWINELDKEAEHPGLSWIRLCVIDAVKTAEWYAKVLNVEPKLHDDRFSVI